MKPTRTWILIADSGRARVLENLGPGKRAAEIAGLTFEADLPATHDLVSDRQGRSFESSSSTRHPLEPRSNPRDRLKHDFLTGIVEEIDARFGRDAFDRLIVVAPPHALGELRGLLTSRVRAAVTGELAKDLTKTPDHELPQHLEDVLIL